ncbi:Homoserine kinase [Paraliobacillus sp. PM-2]|uniref:phosphomevalonate kinase n=1 Tax=Paraliobacillus sp. PM-2 TaxID=1462524 RepID=UPI00061C1117|nr:phosphomevalonate kinase [Paraliobacillus sp. PM-2]CQR48430.1 Homoserine kinase [Paraliobacillus sp. PM-2]
MQACSYQIKTPGKLLIAGEYAVTEPNQPGVVVAVNRYITVQITESNHNKLDLPQLGLENLSWHYDEKQVHFSINNNRLRFIHQAMQVVYRYLSDPIIPFHLTVSSELDDESGKKYGLGSSAAIVVAVITAILKLQKEQEPTEDEIFKLASIAHFKTQGNGSCADIAASTYGGWLYYVAFDGVWLLEQLDQPLTIKELVSMKWPSLYVERLQLPKSLQFCVGWTGKAAATAPMVNKIRSYQRNNPKNYHAFLRDSLAAVQQIVQGCKENKITLVLDGIERNREVLRSISRLANVKIETPQLEKLAEIAATYGCGKSSGAGGGDCGIAFVEGENKSAQLRDAWQVAGIKALDLQPSTSGTSVILNEFKG